MVGPDASVREMINMANLLLLGGDEPGLCLPLEGDRIVLGRDAHCAIVIKKNMMRHDAGADHMTSVSREHAIITRDGDRYYIEDGNGRGVQSRNHTFVNDRQVPFPGRIRLHTNDRIRICDFLCSFHDELESSFTVEESIDHGSNVQFVQTQPADKLRIILEISNSLSNTLDVDALLPRVMDHLFHIFPQTDRGFIILRDATSGRLIPRVSKTRKAGGEADACLSTCVVQQCLHNKQAILGNDPAEQFPDSRSIVSLHIRSLMCTPLWTQDGQALGAIQLDTEGRHQKFTREDLNLLLGVASQASIALCNARLHRDALINQRHARDLELAHQVQHALLPQHLPNIPGYAFYAAYQAAQEIGGDYYDFIPLSEQRLAVLLGDVAGKGVAAALVMAKFSVEARVALQSEPDAAAAMRKLNTLMFRAAVVDRFVTLVAVVIDPATHALTLVNAGHPSPLLYRHATGAVEKATPVIVAGPPIGIEEDHPYRCRQLQVQPGDRLLLFSDGVTEAMDPQDRQFGKKGVRAVLEGGECSPQETVERVLLAVTRHASGASQHDDISLVCFGRTED
jgi:serine phosphatase RsbU (regulator of sigma subunit)